MMLDLLGKMESARFIKSPIFMIIGNRSGTSHASSNGSFNDFIT